MSDDSFKNKLYKLSKSEQEEIDIALSRAMETPLESIDKKAFAGNRMSTPPAYQEDNYYPGLKPVIDDEARPLKYRKARKKGWVYAQASYGVPKRHNEAQLRQLGETWVAQRCKSIIIDEVLSSDFKIVPTNDQDFSAETQRKIKQLNIFFDSMNREGRTLDAVLRPFLNDVLDLGYGIMVKEFHNEAYEAFNPQNQNRLKETIVPHQTVWSYVSRDIDAGLLREVETFDASTFFIQPDYYGREIGWWQRMRNGMPEFFSKREIATMEAYQVSYDEYPISPMKVVAVVVDALMKAVDNTNQFLTDGAIPPGMITLSGISEPEFRKFRDRWNAKYKGNPSQIPLVSAGEGNIEWLPLVANSDDIKQADLIDIYGRIVMSVFHVTPAELGITDAVNKSSAEQQSAVQQRSAIFPFLDRTEDMINRHIVREFDAEATVKFVWDRPQTISDKQAEWNLKKSMLDSGYYTINDFKKAEGEILKAYGHNPFSLTQWIGTAMQTQPQLFGLPQQEESEEQRKLNYVNEQLVYLLESMQHSINSDRDLTPSAIETLVKLRMMKEGLDTGARLVGRPQSVIESDNIYDLQNVNNEYSNTQGVFNYLNEQQDLDNEKGYEGWVKKGVENLSDKDKRFFFVKDELENQVKQKVVSNRIDKRTNPLIKKLMRNLGFIGRRVYDSLDRILGGLIGEGDEESNYVSPQEVGRTLDNLFSPQEFKQLTKDAFTEAYSLGYAMNNEGSIKTKVKDIPIEDISRQAKRFMENRSLLMADRELNKYKQTIKEVIDRGMSTSPRLSAENIKNELKGILPVERMENENQKDFQARKKRWNSDLERVADTEIAMAQNQGRMQQFKDLGVTHFQYYAFRDSKNANERPFRIADGSKTTCRELHGKVFELADPTHTLYMPPHHPRCRCTVQGKFTAEGGFSTAEAKKSLRDLRDTIVEKQVGVDSNYADVSEMSTGQLNRNLKRVKDEQRKAEYEAELAKRKQEGGDQQEPKQEGEEGSADQEEGGEAEPKEEVVKSKSETQKEIMVNMLKTMTVGDVFKNVKNTSQKVSNGFKINPQSKVIEGDGVDVYNLGEGLTLIKAKSPSGMVSNDISSKLGKALSQPVLEKGADYNVQSDVSEKREKIQWDSTLGQILGIILGNVGQRLLSLGRNLSKKYNNISTVKDEIKTLAEESGQKDIENISVAFEGYEINDIQSFANELFNSENWSLGDDKLQLNSESVDKLAKYVTAPEKSQAKFEKVTEINNAVDEYEKVTTEHKKRLDQFKTRNNMNMSLTKNKWEADKRAEILEQTGQEATDQQMQDSWAENMEQWIKENMDITKLQQEGLSRQEAIEKLMFMLGEEEDMEGMKSAEQLVGKEVTTTHTTEAVIPRVIDAREQKIPKILARYRVASNEKKSCKRCQYSQGDQCAKVDGKINPDYVCDKFRKT